MKKYTQTTYSNLNTQEIAVTCGKELVAHASFCHVKQKDEIIITDLFLTENYRDTAFMEVLLTEIEHYATQQQAKAIRVYCGNEPMCPDGQIPLEDEIAFYKQNGFQVKGYVYDIVPILVKEL